VEIVFQVDDADLADWASFGNKLFETYDVEGIDEYGDILTLEEWLGWDPLSDDPIVGKADEILEEIENKIWAYIDSNLSELKGLLEEDPSDVDDCAKEIFYTIIDNLSERVDKLFADFEAANTPQP
jgi:hypothetical protein